MNPLLIILIVLILILIIWLLPRTQLLKHRKQLEVKDYLDLENKLRQTITQSLGGILLISGIYFSYIQNTNLQFKQNTDTFSNSIKQLNDTNLSVKLGGIYTLARLSKSSSDDREVIQPILLNYIAKELTTLKRN
jgi:hypothetical protein